VSEYPARSHATSLRARRRFFTGAGIGGEYAAINSAIDELIPARVRGRVDLIINGSYWLGAAFGALGAYVLLTDVFPVDVGWRLAFGLGAILGVGILLVRRHVPESPRWLFIHGHEQEAERIVDEIEREITEETGEPLDEPGSSITVRQRRSISLREVATTAFKTYPKRSMLGLAVFVGQAFIYNSVTFGLGTFLVEFYKVSDGVVPLYLALFAVSNFLGPLLLGHLFDRWRSRPPITELEFSREVARIEQALAEHGPTERRELARLVGARFWGLAGSRRRCARPSSTAARGGSIARTSVRRSAPARAGSAGPRRRPSASPER